MKNPVCQGTIYQHFALLEECYSGWLSVDNNSNVYYHEYNHGSGGRRNDDQHRSDWLGGP